MWVDRHLGIRARLWLRNHALELCGVLTLLAGCNSPKPCFGLVVGDKVTITVVDTLSLSGAIYYADGGGVSSYLCGFGFDITKGQMLEATVISLAEDVTASCTVATVSVAPFGGWTWTNSGEQPVASQEILSGEYTASNGTCAGTVQMGIDLARTGDPFAPIDAGASPIAQMGRKYTGTGAVSGCTSYCYDNFGVVLQKQ